MFTHGDANARRREGIGEATRARGGHPGDVATTVTLAPQIVTLAVEERPKRLGRNDRPAGSVRPSERAGRSRGDAGDWVE